MLVSIFDEALGIGFLGQVGDKGEHFAAARFADFLRRLLERLLAARADRYVAAFARQRCGDPLADAFAAAGDARDLALQLQVHRGSSSVG